MVAAPAATSATPRARPTSLYGEGHRLTAGAGATGGFEVSIVIPFHTEPAARLVAAGIDPD